MLAQMGEFSFLLSKTGLETGIIGGRYYAACSGCNGSQPRH